MNRAAGLRSATDALRAVIAAPGVTGAAHEASGPAARPAEPCLHCGHPVAGRLMGCKGGHCPNCRHPYPHGDCSD